MLDKVFDFRIARIVACSIFVLAFLFFFYGLMGHGLRNGSFTVFSLPECLTAMLASMTILVAIIEYQSHRDRMKAEVLGQYNERYSRDEHVNKVVDYIIHYMGGIKMTSLPSTHNAEMFMRFFEEMDIQMNEERLDEQQVYILFAYYAIIFGKDEKLRLSLGISKSEYDKSYNWMHFKSFVNRMKEIQKMEGNDSVDKTSIESICDFTPICQLYNEVVAKETSWNYYEEELPIKSFNQLYKDCTDGNNLNYAFICKLLYVGGKESSDYLKKCLKALRDNEQNKNDKELKGRLRHIVSLFFWGHVLCQNIPAIKTQIERQFNQFVNTGMFEEKEDIQQCFSFMWFLLCIFHDFGYAYEKKLISEDNVDVNLKMPEEFMPEIYSTENIEKYAKYRECVFGCKDHGIYGGRVFYNEMLNIGKRIAVDGNLNIHFKIEGVDKIYQYAAWVISCHNIFYNNGNDKFIGCYKCMGLDDFIVPKARCLTLKNNPLLFLFCLADSIEPTKTLTSPDGNSDYEVCRELKISFNKEKNLMRFDLSNIPCKEVADNYEKNIKGLDDWLIDVSEDLILKFG